MTLLDKLRGHDWFYDYSDDGRVWSQGNLNESKLREELKTLNCPFGWWDLHKAIFDFIVEKFTEVEPGKFYRDPNKIQGRSPCRRVDLLTQAEANEIMEWLNAV